LENFVNRDEGLSNLLELTNAVPWQIDWKSKQFKFIGHQVERIFGFNQSSWTDIDVWISRIHPDDRDDILKFCTTKTMEGVDHEVIYRGLTHDNNTKWIRKVSHVIKNQDGEPLSLVGFMFNLEHAVTHQKKFKITDDLLIKQFDFSPSESRVAMLIAEGLSQKEISIKLNIKHDTVRKHLQSIYYKSQASNQSQLIRLLLTFPFTDKEKSKK
jgi:DNA-binding CsgD family transcriptional regulator